MFAVVIDTTESMAVEIEAVKAQVKQIIQTTKGTPDEPLEYLMVPFNDPYTGTFLCFFLVHFFCIFAFFFE